MTLRNEENYKAKIAELEKEIETLKRKQTEKMKLTKYGLNWVDVPEAFEKYTENKIPILKEIKEKAIKNNDGKPTHILIEGDNYHALQCLNYTHAGKIDVIYIDPPYNTGNDDFSYHDARFLREYPNGKSIKKDDPLRHSSWLSFISKRLKLSKNLLSDKGVIFISIDDNEQANLKLLCDEIFGDKNFVANLPTIMNLKGNQDEFAFAGTHEYTLVYAKNIINAFFGLFPLSETDDEFTEWQEDHIGYFKKGANLKSTGVNAPRAKRPNLFFPIYITNDGKFSVDEKLPNSIELYPITDGHEMSWRWSKKKFRNEPFNVIIANENGKISLYKKQRPELGNLPSSKPKSFFYKPEYSSGNGTSQLKDIFKDKVFPNPKPLDLIKDFELITTNKFSIILDFFAGSGTTMHATMKLNEEDGGKRQCILVQMNENNICEEITYERNKRVIQGYTNSKGEQVSGLGNSLKYYKTDFIGKNNSLNATDDDRIELAKEAGCLLSIGENTLEEIYSSDFFQFFSNDVRATAIYFTFDYEKFDEFKEKIHELSEKYKKITVYVFSWSPTNEFDYEFADFNNIEIKAIPTSILEIYKSINRLEFK